MTPPPRSLSFLTVYKYFVRKIYFVLLFFRPFFKPNGLSLFRGSVLLYQFEQFFEAGVILEVLTAYVGHPNYSLWGQAWV